MYFKKCLSIALLALMAMPIPGFSRGTETVGGGDAIYINDEMVLRDFVIKSTMDTVVDNVVFLKSVPDFLELIFDISDAHPSVGYSILKDLSKATIYLSHSDLRILPPYRTAQSGPKAEVQLAVRQGDVILLSPQFNELKDKAYLLIHESLHKLIESSDYDAFHHAKVRSIVKYLKDHRGRYDTRALEAIFDKNELRAHYNGNRAISFAIARNPSLPLYFRCKELNTRYFGRMENEMHPFVGLNEESCSEAPTDDEFFQDSGNTSLTVNEINEKFRFLSKSYTFNSGILVTPLDLQHTTFFQRNKIEVQKRQCGENKEQLNKLLLEIEVGLELFEIMNAIEEKYKKSTPLEQMAYRKWVDDEIIRGADEMSKKIEKSKESVRILEDNHNKCITKFGPNL